MAQRPNLEVLPQAQARVQAQVKDPSQDLSQDRAEILILAQEFQVLMNPAPIDSQLIRAKIVLRDR